MTIIKAVLFGSVDLLQVGDARGFLDDLKASGTKLGLVSGRSSADTDAATLAGGDRSLAGRFDLMLSDQDVGATKPDARVYLAALDRLGLPSAEVIAIEDSEAGGRAALAAGLATFAVGEGFSGASEVYGSLEGVTLSHMAAKLGREVWASQAEHSVSIDV